MRNPTILVVDDEPEIREMVADTLLAAAFNCVTASSGRDALPIIEAGEASFDLLLSDFRMPGGVNGMELAERFRSRFPAVPVHHPDGRPARRR